MTIPFERFKQFVDEEGKLTLDATTFLEELAQPQEWIEVTPQGTGGKTDFENSWVNYNSSTHETAAFYKDPFNRVWIKGAIKTGVSGSTVFTLPSGYRPLRINQIPIVQGTPNGDSFITIDTTGVIKVTGTTVAVLAHIDNVSFRV